MSTKQLKMDTGQTVLPEPEHNAHDVPPLQKSLYGPGMKRFRYRKIDCCVAEHQLEHQ